MVDPESGISECCGGRVFLRGSIVHVFELGEERSAIPGLCYEPFCSVQSFSRSKSDIGPLQNAIRTKRATLTVFPYSAALAAQGPCFRACPDWFRVIGETLFRPVHTFPVPES